MNVTAHPTIPGLYNAWEKDRFFSTIKALNMPEGRVWRTHAFWYEWEATDYLGDFPTKAEAIQAVQKWSEKR